MMRLMQMPDPTTRHGAIHVIGASGRSGRALVQALLAQGREVVPVVRDAARWHALRIPLPCRLADLRDPEALRLALAGAVGIVSTAHARHAERVLAAAPAAARLVLLGSTRKFTRWPDAHGDGVLAGEAAFLASRRQGVMLHPTMIYGAEGEDNVQRLATLLRRLPLVPLPDGGRALVQPIHQSDVTRAMLAALFRDWNGPESLVIAGPRAMRYRDFVAAVTQAAGLPGRPVLPVPTAALQAAAMLCRAIPGLPRIEAAELRRLLEDKAFDIGPMRERLGIEPIPLADGLAHLWSGQGRTGG